MTLQRRRILNRPQMRLNTNRIIIQILHPNSRIISYALQPVTIVSLRTMTLYLRHNNNLHRNLNYLLNRPTLDHIMANSQTSSRIIITNMPSLLRSLKNSINRTRRALKQPINGNVKATNRRRARYRSPKATGRIPVVTDKS